MGEATRVLIAEDEPSIVTSLEFLMRSCGFVTRSVGDGDAALHALASFRPDLAILDVMLPRRSGIEICRFIRGDVSLKGTRVLFLSAKGGVSDVQRGLESGADDYMIKPFSTRELVDRVRALLGSNGVATGERVGRGEARR